MTPYEKQQDERLRVMEEKAVELEAALLRERAKSKALATLFEERVKASSNRLFWQQMQFGPAFDMLCREEEKRLLAALQKKDAKHARRLRVALDFS